MSSLWYRVTDAIDCKLTDAVHSGDGRRWASKVKLGKTYYTIAKTNMPWAGNPDLLEEHVFTKIGLMSARPEGAESVYNCHGGRVYDDRNAYPCKGLMTMREYTVWVNSDDGPDRSGNLNDYADASKYIRRAA